MSDFIPLGITRHEDGGSTIRPLSEAACPACGDKHFWPPLGLQSQWMPREAARTECDECGATFELGVRMLTDDEL